MKDNALELEDLPAGAVLVRDEIVIQWNERALETLGIPGSSEIAGRSSADLFDPGDRDAIFTALASGEARTFNTRRQAGAGWRTIELALTPLGRRDKQVGHDDRAPTENVEDRFGGDGNSDRDDAHSNPYDGAHIHDANRYDASDGGADSCTDVLVLVRDVTDAVRMALAVDRLADGTSSITPEALVDWASPDCARLLETDEITTQALLERLHPKDLPAVLDAVARSRAEPGYRCRFRVRWRQASDGDQWIDEEVSVYGDVDNPDLRGTFIQRRRPETSETIGGEKRDLAGLQSLAEVAPVGIVVAGPSGRTLYCNVLAEQALGPLAAVLGETEWTDAARPEHRVALRRVVQGALNDGITGSTVAAFDQPDGIARWLRVNAAPRSTEDGISSGWIATLEDVSETIEARAQADRLAHLLDAGSDFVIITRPDGLIIYANNAARLQLALATAAEGCTATLRDVLTQASQDRFDSQALPEILSTGTWSGEMTLRLADATELPVSMLGLTRHGDTGDLETIAFIARDIVALKVAEERMRHLANHDALTGLPNRLLLVNRLEHALHRHRRHGWGVALMFCDLDGFKSVNDEYGHEMGDALLAAVAGRMCDTVRETDTVARLGGDEFVVLCEDWIAAVDLMRIARRLIDTVSEPITLGPHIVTMGISIGVAVAGSDCDSYDALMAMADVAMYRAKDLGKGRFELAVASPPQ